MFCCQGCLVVHDLLNESGLGQFYSVGRAPGVKVRRSTAREQWAYLDEPALQSKLFDFTDGRTSRVTFHIPAIHCVACVWLLENLFRLHPGIGQSRVNFPKREVAISFATEKIRLSGLVSLLASIGYEPSLTLGELEKRRASPARRRRWLQIGVAGFGFGNIMLLSLPKYFGLDAFSGALFERVFGYLSLLLATPVLLYSASDYWRSALLSLRQRVLTLDVPIALGLVALYSQSVFEIVSGRGEGYLDSLSGLVFFLLIGRVFQRMTHDRLAFDLDYRSFFPLSVTRKTASQPSGRSKGAQETSKMEHKGAGNAGEERISLEQLEVGDCIVIRNGELIPADAKLVAGPAFIDYSFVTGESEPVAKEVSEYLYAGGRQMGGAIEVEMVKPVSQSYLTSLWNHETFRKESVRDFNTLTNRYSRLFTLAVVAVAVGAGLFWIASGQWPRGIKAFTSVLIVACPCALALAAPFALGTAQRVLARMKVFFKNAQAVERMAKVNTVVFDKTGTLTASSADTVRFEGGALSGEEECQVFSLARHSTHPYAVRIAECFKQKHFPEPVRAFLETPGSGIEGNVHGHEVWLGSRAWLERFGVAFPDLALPPGSVVFLALDGRFRGAFVLANRLRQDADQLLRHLAAQCEVALLSGDNEREREQFQHLLGDNTRLHFNQSPLDKLGFIRGLQEAGKTVMMVGDGLNDAGALKQSDIGVAVVEQAGAFSPASDVILEAQQVPRLADVLNFARRSIGVVRLSLGVSALYNLVGVSVAAVGILSPMICAILMPLSSISVVLFACGVTTWAARRTLGSATFRRPINQEPASPAAHGQLSTAEVQP